MARKRRIPTRYRPEFTTDDDGYTRLVDPNELPVHFYALAHTWRRFRVYRTKGAAERGLKAWARWHESNGYEITGSLKNGYVAIYEGTRFGAANVQEYRDGKRIA